MERNKEKSPGFLRKQVNWENLYFYQKAVTLYQLSYIFAHRYFVTGDRTLDQLNTSGKVWKTKYRRGFC